MAERNGAQDKPAETAKGEPPADAPPAASNGGTQDAAAAASAEMLALVASISHFQGAARTSAEATSGEALVNDLPSDQRQSGTALSALEAPDAHAKPAALAAESLRAEQADETMAAVGKHAAPAASTEFGTALKEVSLLLQPAQQADPVPTAALDAAAGKLAPRVGSKGWDQALGQKIVWMINGEQQSASLELNPPELGPLKVVLQVSNTQANAAFVAAQPEVRQALEAAMPRLRDMLEEAGIQLGQASVDSGTQQEQPRSAHGSSRGSDAASPDADTAATIVTRINPTTAGLGMVDTFA